MPSCSYCYYLMKLKGDQLSWRSPLITPQPTSYPHLCCCDLIHGVHSWANAPASYSVVFLCDLDAVKAVCATLCSASTCTVLQDQSFTRTHLVWGWGYFRSSAHLLFLSSTLSQTPTDLTYALMYRNSREQSPACCSFISEASVLSHHHVGISSFDLWSPCRLNS